MLNFCYALVLVALTGFCQATVLPKQVLQMGRACSATLLLAGSLCLNPTISIADIDAFAAAGKALSGPQRMTSLSGSDFELVQKGEKKLSDGKRAQKRRALQSCKNGSLRKLVMTGNKGIFGAETIGEKDCINRVMDDDFKFVLDALDKANEKR